MDTDRTAATVYEHECVECGRVVKSNEPPIPGKGFICGPHDREHGAGTPGGLGVPARHAPVAAKPRRCVCPPKVKNLKPWAGHICACPHHWKVYANG